MQARWLITLYGQEADVQRLAYAVEETGRKVEIQKLGWMVENILDKPDRNDKDCVIVTGTTIITKNVGRCRQQWVPGSWHESNIMKCSNYYAWWGKHITQSEYMFMPLGELKRQRDDIYKRFGVPDKYGDGSRIFIRPDEGEKIFTGEVVSLYYWESWIQMLEFANVPDNTLCVVARPLDIVKEFRLIMRRGKVVTGSTYRIHGVIEEGALESDPDKEKITQYAEMVAQDNFPDLPPVYVMDIAIESNGRLSLLEIGAATCAGYYACDLKKFVQAASEEAELEYADIFE
jgi:hypothetical protein